MPASSGGHCNPSASFSDVDVPSRVRRERGCEPKRPRTVRTRPEGQRPQQRQSSKKGQPEDGTRRDHPVGNGLSPDCECESSDPESSWQPGNAVAPSASEWGALFWGPRARDVVGERVHRPPQMRLPSFRPSGSRHRICRHQCRCRCLPHRQQAVLADIPRPFGEVR